MTNNEIIDNLIGKICHDLLNPLNTAQMALETGSLDYIKPAIDELTLKVAMIRTMYRDSIENDTKYQQLNQFITTKKLNYSIKHIHENLAPFLFWIAEKMIAKSYVFIESEAIHLQTFFLDEEEIAIIENQPKEISSRNILLYITINKFY